MNDRIKIASENCKAQPRVSHAFMKIMRSPIALIFHILSMAANEIVLSQGDVLRQPTAALSFLIHQSGTGQSIDNADKERART